MKRKPKEPMLCPHELYELCLVIANNVISLADNLRYHCYKPRKKPKPRKKKKAKRHAAK